MGKSSAAPVAKGGHKRRMLGDKIVIPCLYDARASGYGTVKMAAMIDGQVVLDGTGRPVRYQEVGELV